MISKVIDVWAQHPNTEFLNCPMFASIFRWTKQKINDIPIEYTIKSMEEAHVEKTMLTSWWGPSGALISNDEVAKIVQQFPEKFFGIASVDISKPMSAVYELRRCVKEFGFKGLRILPWLWNLPPNDRLYYPIYVECIELDIPFCLQVGHTGPLCPSEPGRPIPYLDQVALDFPELKIVAGHIGYPWVNEMISLATKYQNVYIDTSAYTIRRYPKEIVEYLKSYGKNKVLFATNYPMITAKKCLEDFEKLELDENTSDLFLYKNAERVFSL